MVHSDLKNTIDLIKNINGLQLNFNNQNLSFKNYLRNSKYITFTNQSGTDINVSIDELNNQYKKKYIISNASSVDTSIFNSKNKALVGGNEEFSATSASFASKINKGLVANSLTSDSFNNSLRKNNSKLVGGSKDEINQSQTSDDNLSKINKDDVNNSLTSDLSLINSSKKNNSLRKNNSILAGGSKDEFSLSQTSDDNLSKINKDDVNNSLTSDLSLINSSKKNNFLRKNNSIFAGGAKDEFSLSQTSDNNLSKINKGDVNNSLTSDSSLKSNLSKTSSLLVGGTNKDGEYSMTSLDEASAFETESISSMQDNKNILKGGYDKYLSSDDNIKSNNNENLTSDSDNVNKTFISINYDEIKNNIKNNLKSDTINYQSSSTLNSLTDFKNLSNQASDTTALKNLFKQSGGGNNLNNNFTKSYNINSSSTSSICE